MDKNKRKILPVQFPRITCHPGTAGIMSILETIPESKEWIYSNFILLEAFDLCTGGLSGKDLVIIPGYDFSYYCPWIWRGELDYITVKGLWEDIIFFVMKSIDLDNYLLVDVDQSKFSQMDIEQEFFHDLFIYGYDSETEKLFVADFTFRGKYSFETISFEEFRMAYQSAEKNRQVSNGESGIVLWRVNDQASYMLDTALIKQSMEEYLSGYSYIDRCVKTYHQAPDNVVGINIYQFLIDGIRTMEGATSDIRKCLHNMYDHKKLMLERIQYLLDRGCLRHEVVLKKGKEAMDVSLMICNMYIKYQMKGDIRLKEKIVNGLRILENLDRELFQMVIDSLMVEKVF